METLRRPATRKSLPLSARDLEDLDKLRGSEAHRAALSHLVDTEVSRDTSEASLLHAVLEAGMRAVQQQVEEEGYAEIAADMNAAARQASARRRRPSWADE
jgi:hypothetical protein